MCQQISQRDSKRSRIDNVKTHLNCCAKFNALLSYIALLLVVIKKGLRGEGVGRGVGRETTKTLFIFLKKMGIQTSSHLRTEQM